MMFRFSCAMVLAAVLTMLGGCARVHDRTYVALEEEREQCMLRVGLDLTEGGVLNEEGVLARAFLKIYSSVPFGKARIRKLRIATSEGGVVFSCTSQELDATNRTLSGLPWKHVARFSFREQRIAFIDYEVEVDVDLLDEAGVVLETFKVAGTIKAQTVSRPKWLPY